MDTCVPSPKLNSIYDLDKPSLFCQDPKLNYRFDVCSTVTDESGPLDDCTEDSYVFTPEFLSSMASSSSTSTPAVMAMPNFWNAKGGPEEPLAQEQNILLPDFVSDFLNFDSDDSKFSIPDFDRMTSNPPSSCQTPVPTLELRSDFTDPSLMDRSGFGSRKNVMYSTPQTDNIGQDFVQKKFTTMKSNFPPRKSEPPVGVVAPVKVEEDSVKIFEHSPVKMEVSEKMLDMAEASPQTVPSYTDLNQRSGCRLIKMEPVSPDFASGKRESLKRPSTEDNWDSANHLDMNYGTSFPVTKTKRRRNDSGSSGITSEDGDCDDNDYSQIDYDSDDDNSDLDADLANLKPGAYESLIDVGKKQKQYFWQYNVQAKGPKGTRLKLAVEAPTDPHVLNGFEDPVFDEGNTTVAGIRHGGKARKGDGNEVTPNPYKLFKIGHQLLRLNKKINACQLGSDVPVAQRNESRKEKNKLASRACRLKKKAQHEANKIKLNGLEMEHGQINNVLRLLWPELRERAKRLQSEQHVDVKPEDNLLNKLNGYITSNLKNMVAGHTTNYVNDVIMTVEKGDTSGGLNVRARKS